jgi:hypothetical protein
MSFLLLHLCNPYDDFILTLFQFYRLENLVIRWLNKFLRVTQLVSDYNYLAVRLQGSHVLRLYVYNFYKKGDILSQDKEVLVKKYARITTILFEKNFKVSLRFSS